MPEGPSRGAAARGRPALRTARPEPVRAVTRSLRLLETLADRGRASLVELAAAAELTPSTAHRLLATLVAEGYAGRTEDGQQYRLGYRVGALARSATAPVDELLDVSRPALVRLRDLLDETANLVVLDGASIVYVDQVESLRPVRMFSRLGNRVPAHASGGGKALLAGLEPAEVDELIARVGLERLTRRTITSRGALHSGLAEIRERGWATDDREYDPDVVCVAAAVTEPGRAPAAAISISGPAERMRAHDLDAVGAAVAQQADAVRRALAPRA